MVDTSPLRCVNPLCTGPRELEQVTPTADLLRCAACGDSHPARAYARAYGKRTSQWIVLAAVLLAASWAQQGHVGQTLAGAGMLLAAWSLVRVVRQALVLRVLRPR